jgi:DMSO/TMAO reductase YedYZ molybdopterin-dependent catalytic subunit
MERDIDRNIDLVPLSFFPSENLEFPMISNAPTITPNKLFYVRNHFDYPKVDLDSWTLTIEGMVNQPIELSYSDLKNMTKYEVPATLECAGDKRSLFKKKAQGNQFGLGAISHAVWGGIRLKDVFDKTGISPNATEIVFKGLDFGQRKDMQEPVSFERSLPLEKGIHPDTLLAYEMNGEQLPNKHGFPLRLIVPGWYAVASVKWLNKIKLIDKPFMGPFQSIDYVILKKPNDYKHAEPVTQVLINSTIASPTEEQEIGLGKNTITGYAWAGEQSVKTVEISTDGGKNWNPATLIDPDVPYSWRKWSFEWEAQKPGEYTIMCKAINDLNEEQPLEVKWNVKGYQNNSIHSVSVHVIDPKLVQSVLH